MNPIRVGGEYRSVLYPKSQFKRVTRIEGGEVYFTRHFFDGKPTVYPGEDCLPEVVFRNQVLAEEVEHAA